jgi:hypothetical protein
MKNIKIDELVYSIPESWEDISIELFQDYTRHQLDYLTNDPEDEDYDILNKIRIVSAITRIPIEKLELIDIDAIKLINNSISFINKPVNKSLPIRITVDDRDLMLTDIKKLKLKDVVNIEVLSQDKNPILVLDKIIAILYDSNDEHFKNMSLEEKSDKIRKQVSIQGIYSLPAFFLNSWKILSYHTETYMTLTSLKKEKKWMKWMMTKIKYQFRNIIIHWRLIYLSKKYWILKRFLN